MCISASKLVFWENIWSTITTSTKMSLMCHNPQSCPNLSERHQKVTKPLWASLSHLDRGGATWFFTMKNPMYYFFWWGLYLSWSKERSMPDNSTVGTYFRESGTEVSEDVGKGGQPGWNLQEVWLRSDLMRDSQMLPQDGAGGRDVCSHHSCSNWCSNWCTEARERNKGT